MRIYGRIAVVVLSLALSMMASTDPLYGQQKRGARVGQSHSVGRGGDRHKVPQPEFDTKPFDITVQQLPPAYLGHNPTLAYNAIKDGKERTTTESETTEQHQDRIAREAAVPLNGSLGIGSTYAFQFTPELQYDERTGIMKVYCELSGVAKNGQEDDARKGARVKHEPEMDNHYTVLGADGKQIEIEETKFQEYAVAFTNFREFPVQSVILPSSENERVKAQEKGDIRRSDERLKRDAIVAGIPLPAAEAKRLRETITVLFVCNLEDPYVGDETVHRERTPDKPGVYLARYHYLYVHVLQLWFYDYETGRVLKRMKPGD